MISYLAFSAKGQALAERLAKELGGTAFRCGPKPYLTNWTAEQFASSDALVFVGAVGIAVRAIAPHVCSKTSDPAVVAVDECGQFAVPLLSGHLGGANDLARRIAEACGAVAAVTTATDANGVFSPDAWARTQNFAVDDASRIQPLSSTLLAGGQITVRSDFSVTDAPPAGVRLIEGDPADVRVSVFADDREALHLIPRAVTLGIGCRRGTTRQALENALKRFLRHYNLYSQAICSAASIDLKKEEAGLLEFCAAHKWPVRFYPAAQLATVPGRFSASPFVEGVTGVDNVCERSAVLAAEGALLCQKYAADGVTLAAALRPLVLDWRWQYA